MNGLTQSIILNSFFQFENLLKANLHSWCGKIWQVTETILVLTVFLISKLLFSVNSNLFYNQSVLLSSKNSGPFHHVPQSGNATVSIAWLQISAGFILPLTKFHWISPVWLATKNLNFLLGFLPSTKHSGFHTRKQTFLKHGHPKL